MIPSAFNLAPAIRCWTFCSRNPPDNGIPKGNRASHRGFKITHKTGSIHRISHAAAIIEDTKGNRSIFVMLPRGVPDEQRGEALVAKLAGEIGTLLLLP